MYDRLRETLKEKFEYWGEEIEDDDVIDLSKYDLTRAISDAKSFKLYRYMPANYFNIRNIETQKIHLSPNGVMNDVYEGLPSISKDLPYRKIQKLNDLAYMVCMTETKDSMLMWSHYAANHEGFCVEYDLKRLRQQHYNIVEHIFPVVYTSNRQAFRNIDNLIQSHEILKDAIKENAEYDGEEFLDNILPLFLTKSSVWQYEKEWRIVYTKKQIYDINDEKLYEGNIEFQCISAIYLGYRVHPEIRKNILEIANRINDSKYLISVYQSKLATNTYEVLFDKIL